MTTMTAMGSSMPASVARSDHPVLKAGSSGAFEFSVRAPRDRAAGDDRSPTTQPSACCALRGQVPARASWPGAIPRGCGCERWAPRCRAAARPRRRSDSHVNRSRSHWLVMRNRLRGQPCLAGPDSCRVGGSKSSTSPRPTGGANSMTAGWKRQREPGAPPERGGRVLNPQPSLAK